MPATLAQEARPAVRSVAVRVMCFNEGAAIGRVVTELLDAAAAAPFRVEVEIIDDGSTDDSSARALAAAGGDTRVVVTRHGENLGIGAVLRRAFRPTNVDAVVLLCGDLQFAPRDIVPLVAGLASSELAIARRNARRSLRRRAVTRLDALLTRALVGQSFDDVHWVRAVRGSALRDFVPLTVSPTVDLELALWVRRNGGVVTYVDLPDGPRTTGTARGARPGLLLRSAWDLARVAIHARRR